MGDKILEQLMILTIREQFFAPMYYQTPIENTFYMGRALADLSDRHYALFANNQHPVQLNAYEAYNKFLRGVHCKEEQEADQAIADRIKQVVAERESLLNQKEGERLSVDDLSDVYMQVMAEFRNKNNFSLQTKSKSGEINDYLEVRRPFGAAQ